MPLSVRRSKTEELDLFQHFSSNLEDRFASSTRNGLEVTFGKIRRIHAIYLCAMSLVGE